MVANDPKGIRGRTPLKFHITGGALKGLRLSLESNNQTRPTKALVKKSFFDSMQREVVGAAFIECFAGSGQMGFEAYSRGASKILFFENEKLAFESLSCNLSTFNSRLEACRRGDLVANFGDFFESRRVIEEFVAKSSSVIFYLDPPFNKPDSTCDVYARLRAFLADLSPALLSKAAIIALESMSKYEVYESIGRFSLHKISRFGRTSLVYFR